MNEQRIYSALRNGGLSRAGALGMMGNMFCESLLKGDNVEDRCPLSDSDYTCNVDNGVICRNEWMFDAYGYGLCQWTFYSRKGELYDYAQGRGVSISDVEMQCAFCVSELRKSFSALYSFLCETTDLYAATEKICLQYERPAVNNISARFAAAQNYANMPLDEADPQPPAPEQQPDPGCGDDSCPIDYGSTDSCTIYVRILRKGDSGHDVAAAQRAIETHGFSMGEYGCDGKFGDDTWAAVMQFQCYSNLNQTGEIDGDTWQAAFQ